MSAGFRLLSSLGVVLLAVIATGSSVWRLTYEIRFAPLMDLVSSFQRAQPTEAAFFADFAQAHDLVDAETRCLTHVNDALARFFLVARSAAGEDAAAARMWSARAVQVLGRELRCAPGDGAAWSRLAILHGLERSLDADILREMKLGFKYAPAEDWVVGMRLPSYAALRAGDADEEVRRIIAGDLDTLMNHTTPERIAATYKFLSAAMQAEVLAHLRAEPIQKQRRIYWAFRNLGLDYDASGK